MIWRSPWSDPAWVRGIASSRGWLRAAAGSDHALVHSLVAEQNERVERWLEERSTPCRDILLLIPRCVKKRCCSVGRDGSLDGCLECRECSLGELARLARSYGVKAIVAFRSHIAYAAARRDRPDLIIATACEDRLIKAMASVPEVPALLTPLTGMDRMCVNAELDAEWIGAKIAAAGEVSRARGSQSSSGA